MNLVEKLVKSRALRKGLRNGLRSGLIAGSIASLSSAAVLFERGRRETGSPWACINAPSHWVWGKPALKADELSLRHTATGMLVHHASACFWGVLHEVRGKGLQRGHPATPPRSLPRLLRDAAVTTTVAAIVDLRVVPERLTPGFEHRLSRRGLFLVYLFFGIGLALAGEVLDHKRRAPAER